MKNLKNRFMSLIVLSFILPYSIRTAESSSSAYHHPLKTQVCSVLKSPSSYMGKELIIRGDVYMGVDHMNLSDENCPGDAIGLEVNDEHIFNSKNIQNFYKKITKYGRHGYATIRGVLVPGPNAMIPFILDIRDADNVTPAR